MILGRVAIIVVIIASALLHVPLHAAEPATRQWAPFVIPTEIPEDSVFQFRGEPIGVDAPRVVVKGGHFFVGDRRLRIWGVNLSYGANFPTHADAERVAERLEAFGINSVRFHHMDVEFYRFPQSIWDPADPTKIHPEALDRLDYFIDQLARRGIYANLNLHVSRTHSRHLGLPDSKATGSYDKIVDLFTPPLIEAQRNYARELLTHVNAYRKVRYADDPAIAFVEINNEDSLFMWNAAAKIQQMDSHYAEILRQRFNAWLKERYGTGEKLAAAWQPPIVDEAQVGPRPLPLGPKPAPWLLSPNGGARAELAGGAEANSVRIDVKAPGTAAWHLEFYHPDIPLDRSRHYLLTFRARSDSPRELVVSARQGHAPWQTLGLRQTVKLTPEWAPFELPFLPPQNEQDGRVSFLFGQGTVPFEIADVELRIRRPLALADGESLESGTIGFRADGESPARVRDRMRFLAETEKAYFDDFRTYVRETLGCGALVTGTMAYGFLGVWAQSDMDWIDTHTYWSHPQFPGGAWSETNWTIDQKAFVEHFDQGKIFDDAATRLAGKPFTVSEYSHPAPNDYQAEEIPLIASMAAAQDWDGVWLFGYAHQFDFDKGAFDGFFSMHANPAKWGFVAAGAKIFRDGGIEPLPRGHVWPMTRGDDDPLDELIELHQSHDLAMMAGLEQRWGLSRRAMVQQRIAIRLGTDGPATDLPAYPDSQTVLDLQQGRFTATGRGAMVRIETARASGDRLATDGGFAVLTAVAQDDRALLSDSENVLFTLAARVENTDMGYSTDRRTVGNRWGTAPVRIETFPAILDWRSGPSWRLDALKPDGTVGASAQVEPTSAGSTVRLRFAPEHGTLWYLLRAAGPTSARP